MHDFEYIPAPTSSSELRKKQRSSLSRGNTSSDSDISNSYFEYLFKIYVSQIVIFNNLYSGDDELKIDSGADDDFDEIDDSLHANIIRKFTCQTVLANESQHTAQISIMCTIIYKIFLLIL